MALFIIAKTSKSAEDENLANVVATLYRILGKRILYPFIAKFEYNAIPKYAKALLR